MLGEKRSRKRAALLTTIIMLVASVIPTGVFVQEAEAAADTDYTFKYYDSNSGKWLYKYGYNIEYGGNSTSSTCMFKVFDTEDNYKVYYTYCCDLETYTDANGTFYRRTNIENADHFDAETARKIRTVVIKGYTPPTNNSETIKSSIESIQAEVNAWMERKGDSRRLNLDLSRDDEIETAEKTMITATQISIWSLANSSKLPIECTDNSAKNNVDMIRDYLLDVAKTETPATATTIEDIDLNIGSIVQVADENSAVISGTFAFYNKAEDPRRIVSPPDNTNIKLSVKSGTKSTVILEGTLGELMQSDDEGLEIVFNEETLTYSFEIKHSGFKGKTAADITITATGTQKMPPGAYFYKAQPKNGKDEHKASQNFVGIAEWEHDFDVSAVHDPIAATLSLDATKVFKTVDGKTNALTKGQFEFVLKEVVTNGNRTTKNVIDEATNDTEGNVTFDPITYSKEAKTYKYEISEVVGSIDNVVYDTSAYSVTVTVALNADKTAYVAVPVIKKNDVVVDKAVFENIAVKPATVSLTAKKTLNGNEPGEDKFEFILSEKTVEKVKVGTERVWNGWRWQTVDVYEDKITLTEIERKHNDTKGDIRFSPMSFDANGSHTYIISEVVDNDNEDIIYDGSVYEVKVDVALNGAGTQYVATPTITKTLDDENSTIDSLEDIVFENRIVAPEKTSVSVAKVWDDNNDQDGIRPESVTVQLYANGEASGEPVVLNSANGWSYTWEDLTKKYRGETFAYTVDEVSSSAGYTKEITGSAETGYTIKGIHIPETVDIEIEKLWEDLNDIEGLRAENVTITLKANDKTVRSIPVSKLTDWNDACEGLPKYEKGKEIDYTITVDGVPEGYETEGIDIEKTADGKIKFTVKSKYVPKTSVAVTNVWEDAEDQDGVRPDSIKVQLQANGKDFGEPVDVTADDKWAYEWQDLDKYDDGKEIIYTVIEPESTSEYKYAVTGDGESGYTITGTHEPEVIDIEVKKLWEDLNDVEGLRAENVTITLKANGKTVGSIPVSKLTDWNDAWEDLPKYEKGKEIDYSITVDGVPEGYETEGIDIEKTKDGKIKFTVKSKYVPKTSVAVTNVWEDANDQDGLRPESVQIQLLADGEDLGEPIVLNEKTGWTYKWEDLIKYGEGNAQIEYTVKELNIPAGYTAEITGSVAEGYTITNTHIPEEIDITVLKKWNDNNDQDGLRPDKVEIQLYGDNKKVGEPLQLTKTNEWNDEMSDLPKNEDGKEIDYTIDVKGVPEEYSTEITEISDENKTDLVVTSTYVSDVSETKTDDDSNMILWAMMLLTSLSIMILILAIDRRRIQH